MRSTRDDNSSNAAWLRKGAPGLLLLLLPLVLFWQIWWPASEQRLVFAYGDFVEQYYPARVFVAGELREGRLPLWDAYTYGGEPIAASSIAAAFYPLGLWQALFPRPFPFWALQLEAVFHLGLAGLFTWLFVRRLTRSSGAGLVAGMTFGLGGFLTSYPVLQLAILETAIWLPLGLWLLEVGMSRRSLPRVALAGLALGCGYLAGHPQTFLYMAYLTAAYLLLRAWRLGVGWRFCLAAAMVAGGLCLTVAAVQWLPTWELARLSPRAALSYAEVSQGFQVADLWGLLRPNPGQWSPLYTGLVAVGLALTGLWLLARRSETWFWTGAALIGLLLSLGRNGFLYPLAYRWVPGLAQFRAQERAALVASFAVCVLAGYGYAAWARRRWWPRVALPLVLCVLFADLFCANSGVVLEQLPAGGHFAETPVVQWLQDVDLGVARVSSEGLLPGDGNAGMVFLIRDVTGNTPLHPDYYDQFLEQVPELRWWQLLNVAFVLTERQIEHGGLGFVLEDGGQRLYQLFLNRRSAWVVHDYQLAQDQDAAIELAAGASLEPYTTIILEEEPEPRPQPAAGSEQVTVSSFGQQRLVTDVHLDSPGVVVWSEIWYPGWVARVDGEQVTTLRAYGMLRAVSLPAGSWQVEWRYEPLTVRLGAALSLLGLLVTGGLALLQRRRRRPPG